MLNWALTFFIVALIAGALGFGGIAGDASWIAYVLFVVFIVLFLISLFTGRRVPPVQGMLRRWEQPLDLADTLSSADRR